MSLADISSKQRRMNFGLGFKTKSVLSCDCLIGDSRSVSTLMVIRPLRSQWLALAMRSGPCVQGMISKIVSLSLMYLLI